MILCSRWLAIIISFFLPFSTIYGVRWAWVKNSCAITYSSLFMPHKKTQLVSCVAFKKKNRTIQLQYLFKCQDCIHEWHQQIDCLHGELLNAFDSIRNKRSMVVRVLLDELHKDSTVVWVFTSPQGLRMRPKGHIVGEVKKSVCLPSITIAMRNGVLLCNGKKLTEDVRITPVSGHSAYNGIVYDGDFCIMTHKEKVLCINQVDLEDYITAVLKTESWPGWPLEVNKVFAVACRSYVAYKASEARRGKRPFHVRNTNVHQTYRGRHDLPILKAAVAQTRGMVLGFSGKPILAMFDCCCGGIIPAHIADFDFNKVPYLARPYACTHCKLSSLYSWQVSYENTMFESLIKMHHDDSVLLSDIRITQKDKAGLVTQVALKSQKVQTLVSGKKLYSLLKDVKSFYFDVHKKSGKIIFTGRGFGHHLGLCQWGARQMVRDGWGYKSILQYYYPDTYFMQLM